jgi:hypothetical protein
MNKDEMDNQLKTEIGILKEHSEKLAKLLDDLQLTVRPNSDVTFGALDRSKDVLEGMSSVRSSIESVKRTLKQRAIARMKEV